MSTTLSSDGPSAPAPKVSPELEGRRRFAAVVLGARQHYAVARILQDAGLLATFFTDSYSGTWPVLSRVLATLPGVRGLPPIRRWLGRRHPALRPELVSGSEWLGLRYGWLRQQSGLFGDQVHVKGAAWLAARVARQGAGGAAVVWGLNSASLELFRWARGLGMKCVLEQVIAPASIHDEVLRREHGRWAGWTACRGLESRGMLGQREEQEWALADRIISCSGFVTDGLLSQGVPAAKCWLVPFGVDLDQFPLLPSPPDWPPERRLRVLFVGEVGLRKGAPYLLEALKNLGPGRVEGRLVGTLALNPSKVAEFSSVARLPGPVPRMDMNEHWRWADLLVLPSLCEGSALVSYEALASGLAVVATSSTGTLVRDGIDGTLVPSHDTGALTSVLARYQAEPGLLAAHRREAAAGRRRVGFDRYREDLLAALEGL